jgi:hypothetical protein
MGADRITQGQIFSTEQDVYDSPGAIIVDALNGILSVVTNARTLQVTQQALATAGAQTAVTAITVAQNLYSKLLAAGVLNAANRTAVIEGWGIYSSAGGTTPTISIALVLGGVTLCTITSSAINTAANVNLPLQFTFQFTVVTTGAAATIECHGTLSINLSANTPGAAPTLFTDTNTGVSAAVNLVTAETLAVTIAASSAVSSAQARMISLQLLS